MKLSRAGLAAMADIYGPYVREMLAVRYGIETTSREGDDIVRHIDWSDMEGREVDRRQLAALVEERLEAAMHRWRVVRRIVTVCPSP